jgi:hypothetical protein
MATTVVAAGGHRPPGRLAPPPGVWPGQGEPYSDLTLGRYFFPATSRGPPSSDLASRWRRFRCDRQATASADPSTRPAARPERGVPARAGTRDRPVPARGPGAATVIHVDGLAAFQVAQRRPIAAHATAPPPRRAHLERRDAHPCRVVATDGHRGRGPAPPVSQGLVGPAGADDAAGGGQVRTPLKLLEREACWLPPCSWPMTTPTSSASWRSTCGWKASRSSPPGTAATRSRRPLLSGPTWCCWMSRCPASTATPSAPGSVPMPAWPLSG